MRRATSRCTMTVTVEDGQLTFKLSDDVEEKSEDVYVKAVDSDGDSAGTLLTLNAPVITTPEPPTPTPDDPENPLTPSTAGNLIIADEGALASGSGEHAGHGYRGEGKIVVDVHGEQGGSITLTDAAGHTVTLSIPEDEATEIGQPESAVLVT